MPREFRWLPILLLYAIAASAEAQPTPTEQAAFQAIILTPMGALPQVLHVAPANAAPRRFDTELLYGRYRFQDRVELFHNVGLSGRFRPWRRLSVGATLGNRSCDGCEGLRMASADVHADLWHQTPDEPGEGRASLGLRFLAGIGEPNRSRFNARSLAVGLAGAVTLPQSQGAELTLFFSPSVAYGYINDGSGAILGFSGGDGTVLPMMGAGVGYTLRNGLGIHAALHRIVVEDSPTQFGVGLSWGFGTTRAGN